MVPVETLLKFHSQLHSWTSYVPICECIPTRIRVCITTHFPAHCAPIQPDMRNLPKGLRETRFAGNFLISRDTWSASLPWRSERETIESDVPRRHRCVLERTWSTRPRIPTAANAAKTQREILLALLSPPLA